MGEGQTSGALAAGPIGLGAVAEAMRPGHWIKNAFVAAPLLFSGRFTDAASWALCLGAVAAFCLLSSAVYLLNDVCDRGRDRHHPVKRRRAVASGRLTPAGALGAAAVLLVGGFAIIAALEVAVRGRAKLLGGLALLTWTGAYLLLNVLYSLWLKDKAVVDVLVVALGFVLRAMAGAAAIVVPVSPWLVVCTFSLCLFIAVAKRRSEIAELPAGESGAARAVNRAYDAAQLGFMLTVSTAMALFTYTIYCLAPQTVERVGSAHMVWTVPVVVYGMFRYHHVTRAAGPSDPVRVLLRDRVMWLVLGVYVAMSAVIVKFGGHAAVRDILGAGQ